MNRTETLQIKKEKTVVLYIIYKPEFDLLSSTAFGNEEVLFLKTNQLLGQIFLYPSHRTMIVQNDPYRYFKFKYQINSLDK